MSKRQNWDDNIDMDGSSSTVATLSIERSVYRLQTLDQVERGGYSDVSVLLGGCCQEYRELDDILGNCGCNA